MDNLINKLDTETSIALDNFIDNGFPSEIEYENLEAEVQEEGYDYPTGYNYSNDSVIYTDVPARDGYINNYTLDLSSLDRNECYEYVAKFLNKDLNSVTKNDIENIDVKKFEDFLYDELFDRAKEQAVKDFEKGIYDSEDVDWIEPEETDPYDYRADDWKADRDYDDFNEDYDDNEKSEPWYKGSDDEDYDVEIDDDDFDEGLDEKYSDNYKNDKYEKLVGKKIRIIDMDDPYAAKDYNGREGIIEYVATDPFGDVYFDGTWGSLSIYPKVDTFEYINDDKFDINNAAKQLVAMAKKDGRKLSFDDAKEVLDQSFNQKIDTLDDFYHRLNFDEYDNVYEGLFDAEKTDINYGHKAWVLNQIISSMNDETAYYDTEWLYVWPDGETEKECEDDFGDEESFKDLEDTFLSIYQYNSAEEEGTTPEDAEYNFHRDGLYNPTKEAVELAHEYDKKLGLEPIQVLGNVKECVDDVRFAESVENDNLETFNDKMDFLAGDEEEAIDGYDEIIPQVEDEHIKDQLTHIRDEEKAHKKYLNDVKKDPSIDYEEPEDNETDPD